MARKRRNYALESKQKAVRLEHRARAVATFEGTKPDMALASQHPPIENHTLCSESGVVLVATVSSIDDTFALLPVQTGGTSMAATTRVKLTVHTVFKGSVVASTAVVRLPGGETPNGRRQRWSGTPVLTTGDRVMVFATEEGSPAMLNLTSFSNGILIRDSYNGNLVPRDGQGSLVGSWPVNSVPDLWTRPDEGTVVDDEDTNTAGGDRVTTDDVETVVASDPIMAWTDLASAVTASCHAVSTHEQTAQSIDHTGL